MISATLERIPDRENSKEKSQVSDGASRVSQTGRGKGEWRRMSAWKEWPGQRQGGRKLKYV